jgi:hypothetical protein
MTSPAAMDREFWALLTEHQKRALFHELVEAVTVKDGEIVGVELKL